MLRESTWKDARKRKNSRARFHPLGQQSWKSRLFVPRARISGAPGQKLGAPFFARIRRQEISTTTHFLKAFFAPTQLFRTSSRVYP